MESEEKVTEKKVNPSVSYLRPRDVVKDSNLTREQKLSILREWHYDAVRLQASAGENMSGGEPDRLQSVSNALLSLDVSATEKGKPADQSGAARPSSLDNRSSR